jgi:CheY-like chemotaxis protein
VFLQHRRQDTVALLDALSRGDFGSVERLGHSMKGSGASFGFQAISDLGAALEKAAWAVDERAARLRVAELAEYLDQEDGRDVAPQRDAPASTRDAVSSRRILIVEDDHDLRECFCELLEQSGHQVAEARDGLEALARILEGSPDVVIIDIGLPGMNGYEVARRVRAALGPTARLIALTGHSRESDRLEALEAGFDDHLTKPVDLEALTRLLAPRAV